VQDIISLSVNKKCMDADGHFPYSIAQLMDNKGVGTKLHPLVFVLHVDKMMPLLLILMM